MSKPIYAIKRVTEECDIHTAKTIKLSHINDNEDGSKRGCIVITGVSKYNCDSSDLNITFDYRFNNDDLTVKNVIDLINEAVNIDMDEYKRIQFNAYCWESEIEEITDILNGGSNIKIDFNLKELESFAFTRLVVTKDRVMLQTTKGKDVNHCFIDYHVDLVTRKLMLKKRATYEWIVADIDHNSFIKTIISDAELDYIINLQKSLD